MLDSTDLAAAADALRDAERDRVAIPPLITTYPGIDVGDAYRIQLLNIERRTAPVVGHKVGLSSKAMQQMMGVDEPDYGHLLADMRCTENTPVDTGRYLLPRVEPEVGFILGDDLPEDCTEEQALAATEAIAPALELIDSRIVDWKIALPDTIADNASSAGFVLGAARLDPRRVDLTALPVALYRNDEAAGSGTSAAVLGNPLVAVAWLARTVARFGVRLRAGHVVLPGSCTRAVDARPGDRFRAEFGPLGAVTLTFAPADVPQLAKIPAQRGES
ncbi:2-keto-4-pentenoate hydratase [Cryptosporangium phraense]|uniref:2-keto-4-pentenoate hydratase n=1 Tax=Cryptosporangium phraense TaxID=2593070 RepID=A0A545B0I0_9ACTN|nr:2-keto-4-pentenoate hydratase [Cryptosporangium phraense]TQS47093.1 2-keto-4-pentenoate hydratase [Cryptosporangium phraense]